MEEIDSLDPDDRHFIARKSDLDDRLYKMYDKIEEVENGLMDARAKKQAIEADKITGDNIYKILICFDKLYATMTEAGYFFIYVIMYYASMLYLMVATVRTAAVFQNRSRTLIYPLTLFLGAETVIQIALPELHVTWLCVTLLSVLYYIYCSEMWNQLDALTGLLDQNSYLNRTIETPQRRGAGGVRCG